MTATELPKDFERVDNDTLVVRNVFQCQLCRGPVDRFCSTTPHRHWVFANKSPMPFLCRQCGAVGDKNTAIMARTDLAYYEELCGDKKGNK